MASNKSDSSKSSYLGDYATRHPRRMYTGMLALGTMVGAGIMAAKSKRDQANDPLHKLMGQLKRD